MCITPPKKQFFACDLLAGMPTSPLVHSRHSNLAQEATTHKEYGDIFTVCTQCKRVLLPSLQSKGISVRISREEDDQWVDATKLSDSQPAASLSHGLCNSCFNHMDANLLSSPTAYPSAHKAVLNKSTSSPQLTRHFPPSAPLRVLVVDDNRLQRQIHKRMVEQAGLDCDVASGAAQAIELVQKHTYALILMDLVMSPTDGWSISRKIRATLQHTLGTPTLPKIIAVTGLHMDEALLRSCAEAGMEEVVKKPVSPTMLHKVLSKHSCHQN